MPPGNAFIIVMVSLICLFCHGAAREQRPAAPIARALSIIKERYVKEIPEQQLVEAAFRGIIAELDEHSEYIPPASSVAFNEELAQSLLGIGILISKPRDADLVRVIAPLVGSPAQAAGFLPGDDLVMVNGESLKGIEVAEVQKRLRGPEGTTIQVRVKRYGKDDFADLSVTRAIIPMESVVGFDRDAHDAWIYHLPDHPEIAYLRISMFGERTVKEVQTILESREGRYQSLIIDLRDNPGGLLDSASELCDMFLDQGTIVEIRERTMLIDPLVAEEGVLVPHHIPVVILINRNSASASEVTAACLKENGRAMVAGERSFGKGTVQEVVSVDTGRSLLKLTTAYYYGPRGLLINRDKNAKEEDTWGVHPHPELTLQVTPLEILHLQRRWSKAKFPQAARESEELWAELEKSMSDAIQSMEPSDGDTTGDTVEVEGTIDPDVDRQLDQVVEYLLNRGKE